MSLAQPVLPVAGLRRLVAHERSRTEGSASAAAHGPCAVCGGAIAEGEHPHAADTLARSLGCLCRTCDLVLPTRDTLSSPGTQVDTRWQRIPREVWADEVPSTTVAALDLPVGLAFLLEHGQTEAVIAGYPGAAGIVESTVPVATWRSFRAEVPLAASVHCDVEALLLHERPGDPSVTVLRLGVDRVYALAGEIRAAASSGGGSNEIARIISERISDLRRTARRWPPS